jgi:hypothetical protein
MNTQNILTQWRSAQEAPGSAWDRLEIGTYTSTQTDQLQRQHAVPDVIPGPEQGDQWQERTIQMIKDQLPEGCTLTELLRPDDHQNIRYKGRAMGLRVDHKEEGTFLSTYHLTSSDMDGTKKSGTPKKAAKAHAWGLRVVTNTTGWEVGRKGFAGARVHKGGLQSRTIMLSNMSPQKMCEEIAKFL